MDKFEKIVTLGSTAILVWVILARNGFDITAQNINSLCRENWHLVTKPLQNYCRSMGIDFDKAVDLFI